MTINLTEDELCAAIYAYIEKEIGFKCSPEDDPVFFKVDGKDLKPGAVVSAFVALD